MPVNFVKREDLIEENACIGNTATQKYPVSRAVDSHQDNMLCRIKKRVHEEVVPEEKVKPKHILGKIRKMDRMAKLQCGNILRELMKHSYGWIFYQPVDPVEWNIPDYFSVIREPMDLGTIKHKLNGNRYSSMEEFAADVRLTFSNAMLYNPPRNEVHECAKLLNGAFNKKWKSLEAELKGQGPTAANYDGQDSWQSVRKSCQDNKKEFPLMQVNPVKMVKNWSQFLGNNVQKAKCPLCGALICHCREKDTPDQAFSSGLSPGRSSEHNVCGASEMNDGMLCGSKRRVHEEVVPEENMKHVYIRSRSTEINDADGNPSLNIHDSPNDAESTSIVKKEIPAIDLHEKTTLIFTPLAEQSDHRGFENSKSDLNFDDIKGFEDFKIHVNGEIIDSEIPLDIRIKYYQLCCRQKKFIHDRVMKGLNSKLVVAMILEIVSIADATKAASISTPPHDLKRMGKAIKSFKDLGMAVGSLRAKIDTLTKFSSEHQNVEESMKMKLAEIERERKAFEEKKAKIEELIESARVDGELIGHLEEKVDALKEKREKLRLVFNEVAGLTW